INDPEIFGTPLLPPSASATVMLDSWHSLKKEAAGCPLRRPAWFFDVTQQGEGLADVGTHLVDLVTWTLFRGRAVDYRPDVRPRRSRRWPTELTREDFQSITGEREFPAGLSGRVVDGRFLFDCNNRLEYDVGDVRVILDTQWEVERPGGDLWGMTVCGTQADVRVIVGDEMSLMVAPKPCFKVKVGNALRQRVESWQERFPGVGVMEKVLRPCARSHSRGITEPLGVRLWYGCQAPEHEMDHTHPDHRLARLRQPLVVLAQPPRPAQPGDSPLHHPPLRQPHEPLRPRGPADHRQPERREVEHLLPEVARRVLAVGVDHLQPRQVVPEPQVEQVAGGPGVVDVGRRHQHGQEQAQAVHPQVPLAAQDLLAAVEALHPALAGGLDGLAVGGRRAGALVAAGPGADLPAQGLGDALPGAV